MSEITFAVLGIDLDGVELVLAENVAESPEEAIEEAAELAEHHGWVVTGVTCCCLAAGHEQAISYTLEMLPASRPCG